MRQVRDLILVLDTSSAYYKDQSIKILFFLTISFHGTYDLCKVRMRRAFTARIHKRGA